MKAKPMRRMYLREATVMLAIAKLAVRFLSTRQLISWASRPPRRINRFSVGEIGWCTWAIETVGEKKWIKANCLPRALAAQAMLRRRGIASKFCLGVARDGEALSAHAWIEVGQQATVGADGTTRVARLVEFGGARS